MWLYYSSVHLGYTEWGTSKKLSTFHKCKLVFFSFKVLVNCNDFLGAAFAAMVSLKIFHVVETLDANAIDFLMSQRYFCLKGALIHTSANIVLFEFLFCIIVARNFKYSDKYGNVWKHVHYQVLFVVYQPRISRDLSEFVLRNEVCPESLYYVAVLPPIN